MLKIIKKYKKFLICISFAYIYLLILFIAPSNYLALTPGELTNVKSMYEIEDVKINDNFNTVSIYNWYEITVFQKWLITNNDRFEVREQSDYEKSLSRYEQNLQGKISNISSHKNAVITAYTYANKIDSNITIDYNLESLTVYATSNKELRIGDEIIEINNKKIDTKNYQEYLEQLSLFDQNNSNRIQSNNLTLKILRKNVEIIINQNELKTIYFYPNYNILETTPKYDGFKDKSNHGGPSGGMIQSLAIYSSLLNINFGNLKIAGTGTIDTNTNNTIGEIGGIIQKYYTVKDNKVDLFIIPTAHLNDIKDIIKPKDKITVITVDTFDDCINKVVEVYGDKNV